MIVRMAEAAGKRRRFEWVLLAQAVSAGVNAGMTGKDDSIRALARHLGVPMRRSRGGAKTGGVGDLVNRLYARMGATYAGAGRGAGRRAGGS